MIPQVINTEPLTRWDVVPIILYALLTLTLILLPNTSFPSEQFESLLFVYIFMTPPVICSMNYKSLQKVYSALIWLTISLCQYAFYIYWTNRVNIEYFNTNLISGFKWIWVFFLIHHLFRFLVVKLTKEEYDPLQMAWSGSRFFRGEKFNYLSAIFAAIFFISWILVYTNTLFP